MSDAWKSALEWSVLVLVVGLATYVVAIWIYRAFVKVKSKLDADRYSLRHKIRLWRQRLLKWLKITLRHGRHAAVYIICVLVLSLIAPVLFVVLRRLLGGPSVGCQYDTAAIMLVAAVTGFAIAFVVSALRGRRTAFAEKTLDALAATVEPDAGTKISLVPFFPMTHHWADGSISRHYNVEVGRAGDTEWLVALQQAGGPYRGAYTLSFLKSQIEALERYHGAVKANRAAKSGQTDGKSDHPAISWVCFVSATGRFHALQSWKVFRYQIIMKENAGYLRILNAGPEDAFWDDIKKNMDQSSPQTNPSQEPQYFSDAIPGLDCFWIAAETTRENALRLMAEANKARAMLVEKDHAGAPLGVVTFDGLTKSTLVKHLKDQELECTQPRAGRSGAEPPGLPKSKAATTPH